MRFAAAALLRSLRRSLCVSPPLPVRSACPLGVRVVAACLLSLRRPAVGGVGAAESRPLRRPGGWTTSEQRSERGKRHSTNTTQGTNRRTANPAQPRFDAKISEQALSTEVIHRCSWNLPIPLHYSPAACSMPALAPNFARVLSATGGREKRRVSVRGVHCAVSSPCLFRCSLHFPPLFCPPLFPALLLSRRRRCATRFVRPRSA